MSSYQIDIEQQWHQHSFVVSYHEAGKRLDSILCQRFAHHWSRSHWQRRIREGSVILDQGSARPASRLQSGQTVSYFYPSKAEPQVSNEDIHFKYEDEDLAVIVKPTNLPVHPSGVYRKRTLYHLLKRIWGEATPIRLLHRLDRETSGLLVVAKNKKAASLLNLDFEGKGNPVNKEYLVLVEGDFPDYYDACGWIGPDANSPVRKKRRFIFDNEQLHMPKEFHNTLCSNLNKESHKIELCRTEFFCVEKNKNWAYPW